MENYDNGLSSETIGDWIKGDQKLWDILTAIENYTNSPLTRAEMIFDQVSELYEVPRYPDDVDDEKLIHGLIMETSVYEQVGKLKYLEPEPEKLPELILNAIYFMITGTETDMSFVLNKFAAEGGKAKEISGLGFKNDGVDVQLIFVKKGESWYDLGCKYFIKEIK